MKRIMMLALVLAACDDPMGPAARVDLISNGRFEQGLAPWAGEFPELETGAARYPVGTASLRTSYDGTRRSIYLTANGGLQFIAVTPGDTLWLGYAMRLSAEGVAPRVNVEQFSSPGVLVGSFSRGITIPSEAWVTAQYPVILGPDVRYVSVVLDVVGPASSGTAWFDEIHLWTEPCESVNLWEC